MVIAGSLVPLLGQPVFSREFRDFLLSLKVYLAHQFDKVSPNRFWGLMAYPLAGPSPRALSRGLSSSWGAPDFLSRLSCQPDLQETLDIKNDRFGNGLRGGGSGGDRGTNRSLRSLDSPAGRTRGTRWAWPLSRLRSSWKSITKSFHGPVVMRDTSNQIPTRLRKSAPNRVWTPASWRTTGRPKW